MTQLDDIKAQLLADRKITPNEVAVIENGVRADGRLDIQDVKFLVELLVNATEVCPEFDAFFFPALKHILLQDGEITTDEHFYLLKMLYSDGVVRDIERAFLLDLRKSLKRSTPEFDELCTTALKAPSRDWNVEGATFYGPR